MVIVITSETVGGTASKQMEKAYKELESKLRYYGGKFEMIVVADRTSLQKIEMKFREVAKQKDPEKFLLIMGHAN